MVLSPSSPRIWAILGMVSILLVLVQGKIWLNATGNTGWDGTCSQLCTALQPCSFPSFVTIRDDCHLVLMSGFPSSVLWDTNDRNLTLSTNGLVSNTRAVALGTVGSLSVVTLDQFEMNTTNILGFGWRTVFINNSRLISSSGIDGDYSFFSMVNFTVTQTQFVTNNSALSISGAQGVPCRASFKDVSFEGTSETMLIDEMVSSLTLENVTISNSRYFAKHMANMTILNGVRHEYNQSSSLFANSQGQRLEIYNSQLMGINGNTTTPLLLSDTLIIDNSTISGGAFSSSVNAPNVYISDSTFSTTSSVNFATLGRNSSVVIAKTTFSRSDFGSDSRYSYISLQSDGSIISLDLSNIQFKDPFDPIEDCQWIWNGFIHLVNPLIADSICIPTGASAMVSGSPLEIKASLDTIGSGLSTSTLSTSDSSALTLHPIHIGVKTTFNTFDGNFTFIPDYNDPTNGMRLKSSNFPPCNAIVEWRGPTSPPLQVDFLLANGTTAPVFVTSSDPHYTIGSNFSAGRGEVTFSYLPQLCNPLCDFNHTTVGPGENCESTEICPCQSGYGGDYCGCSTEGLFYPFECSPNEEKVWVIEGNYTLPVDKQLTVPPSYTLIVLGNLHIEGEMILQGGSTVTVSQSLTVNGILNATFYLLERDVEGGCVVYPEMHIESENLDLQQLAKIELVIDISQLSGNCTFSANDTLGITNSLFYSLNGTSMDPKMEWNVVIVDKRPGRPLTPTEVSLVNSKEKGLSKGTTTLLTATTSDPSSCVSFRSSPGALSMLIVPCATPNPDGSPAKHGGGVKWYYYTIPLIAVAAITVAIGAVILKTRCVQRSVLPYRGTF